MLYCIKRWLGSLFNSRFHEQAAALQVSPDDLYNALVADAENEPPNWNLQGRQAGVWKQLGAVNLLYLIAFFSDFEWTGYVPDDMFSPGGANTKQVSRTLEVGINLNHFLLLSKVA